MRDIYVSFSVPYVSQFATPELARAFIYGERELETDPNWAVYGAQTPQEYAHWAVRSCGVVCVKMAVEGVTGRPSGTVIEWVKAGLDIDGYLVALRPERTDRPVEKGWKHAALARLLANAGCQAELVTGLSVTDLATHIQADRLVIASVSSELGEHESITRRSGHLVVAFGMEMDDGGEISGVIVHNPSGRTAALRAGARIPVGRFAQAFSGRGIVVSATP